MALGASAPEIAALQEKAKSAFDAASKQTAALIEETKKRMASLEQAVPVAGAAPEPKPAPPATAEPVAAKATPEPAASPAPTPKGAPRRAGTTSRAKAAPKSS